MFTCSIALTALLVVGDAAAEEPTEPTPEAGPTIPGARPEPNSKAGARLFRQACATCHGIDGDGKGPAARFMEPPPRDLGDGAIRFRSTPYGQRPLDADLYRTIANGLKGTPMLGFSGYANDELWQLVYHVRALAEPTDGTPRVVAVPPSPPVGADMLKRGAEVYGMFGCTACHGNTARGDGPTAGSLVDTAGHPVIPTDLTRPEQFKRGTDPIDLYRTLSTGLNGTPMPGFEMIPADDRWALVQWILSGE
jgi:mono/diheme cytochrome c family protein